MKYAEVEKFCLSLPGATLSIQWGSDHVYKVGGKMFAAMGAPLKGGVSAKKSGGVEATPPSSGNRGRLSRPP